MRYLVVDVNVTNFLRVFSNYSTLCNEINIGRVGNIEFNCKGDARKCWHSFHRVKLYLY